MESKQGVKVLIAGSFLQLFLGIIYVWSVFVGPVDALYESWDVAAVKLMSSYMLSFFVVGILVGGKLQPKLGSEKTVLLGGLMLAGGMLASSFIPDSCVWLMYVTYGIIGGFGVGAGYNTVISAAQKWFPKKRGLATGIGVCAFGFSTVLFAPLIEALIGKFGVPNTFRILAAAFFVVVIALFKFIKTPENSGAAAGNISGKQYTTSEALKTKEFYFITLSMMFLTASYFILNPSFKSLFESAPALGTALVMISGVANALGRLGVPMLSDKIGREKAIIVITLATAVCTAFLYFSPNPWIKIFLVAIIAFCYGGSSGVYPVLTADYFGIKNVGANYGAIMMGFAASALFFPMIMSLVQDLVVKSIILAVVAAIGAVLMVLLMQSKKATDK